MTMGAVAIALLLANGLKALQAATIASALPFAVILLVAIWGLFKALGLMPHVAACAPNRCLASASTGRITVAGNGACATSP